ncbi:hypothetical protein [Variovorax sp.]|uniref:hypothetical protein n=1 Tax=Variovorax sp. TaxID=1871043 RepID=UPI0040379813
MSTPLQLTDELAVVLRAVRMADFAEVGAIAKLCSIAVTTPLRRLMLAGHVRSHQSRRADQSRTRLYSISAAGEAALHAHDAAARRQAAIAAYGSAVAQPRTTRSTGTYNGAELRPTVTRPGAMDAFELPSRVGSRLRYRDGRVQELRAVAGVDMGADGLTFGPVTLFQSPAPCAGFAFPLSGRAEVKA